MPRSPPVPRSRKAKATGRPSAYKPEYADRAFELALLGLTDTQIAKQLGTSRSGLDRWKKAYPEFASAFERGRQHADGKIARSLYERAKGYSHPAEKIFCTKDGEIKRVSYIQHYPPDTQAIAFHLSNRQRELWSRDPEKTAGFNVNISLETVVLNALKLTEARQAKGKEIGPAPGEDDMPKLLEPPSDH